MRPRIVRSPVDICFGTKPSQAAKSRPLVKAAPLAMAATIALALRPANWAKHSFGPWLTTAAKRLHHNVLPTALANKLARIAWTVLAQRRNYETRVIADLALARQHFDLLGNLLNALIETSPIAAEVLDDPDHTGRQHVDALGQNLWSC
jgi:hypothetical protein